MGHELLNLDEKDDPKVFPLNWNMNYEFSLNFFKAYDHPMLTI